MLQKVQLAVSWFLVAGRRKDRNRVSKVKDWEEEKLCQRNPGVKVFLPPEKYSKEDHLS